VKCLKDAAASNELPNKNFVFFTLNLLITMYSKFKLMKYVLRNRGNNKRGELTATPIYLFMTLANYVL
jgi:hypothetical protein